MPSASRSWRGERSRTGIRTNLREEFGQLGDLERRSHDEHGWADGNSANRGKGFQRIKLDIYGSPDITEIDGLGGANVLTSKTAIISRSSRADADIDLTFGQVMINEPLVDYRINCGNISAGVGPFAIDEGLVPAVEPVTTIRIFNTNTQKVITAYVPVKNGKAVVAGDYQVAGAPGAGAKITLDFAQTAGTLGKGLLPTGLAKEQLPVEGLGVLTPRA